MDIRQIEYFLALCEQEHISSTAVLLGISQPALSKSIASLEKEVGVTLFDRHKNYIKLNDNGRSFAAHAQRALSELHLGLRQMQQVQYDTCGEIRIACHAFADSITDCLLAYIELNPKIKITVGQSNDADAQMIKRFDFILSSQSEAITLTGEEKNWHPYPLFKENHCILISPRYREYPELATCLSIKELEDDFFVEMPDVSLFYSDITFRLCHAAGFYPKIFCSTEDFMTKLRFVDAGKAICILPECCIRLAKRLSPDVRVFGIKDANTQRTVCLMRQKETKMSEAALDFWSFVQDYFAVSNR